MDEELNWVLIIFLFSINDVHRIKIINPTPIRLITEPIDEIIFHLEKNQDNQNIVVVYL